MKRNLVVALTGASGAVYGVRLVEYLLSAGCDVHLTISSAAQRVLKTELDLAVDLDRFEPAMLLRGGIPGRGEERFRVVDPEAGESEPSGVEPGTLHYHHFADFLAPVASGSFRTCGMVVCPCSCGTLSAIVHGSATNLIQRAAEVHLKERRTLILVPRETPLSLAQLDNMRRAMEAGAVVLPAMPGFYHGPRTVGDLVDFIVARICDQLDVPNALMRRWGSEP